MRAVIYARVSTKEQEEHGYSIPSQVKLCRTKAHDLGLKIVKEFAGNESAFRPGRKMFNEMKNYIVENNIEHIVCYSSDRLSRNDHDTLAIKELRQHIGIKVHYVNCNFDDNAEGQLMEGLIGKFDIYQSARNRDRVLKAFDEKLSRGEWCWYAPYGYRNASNCNGKIVAIQPEEAENVLYLYRKYASGNYSLETLTKEFENDGRVYKPNQPKLTRSYVADMLKKSFYYGMMNYKNRFYPGNYEPIISKELFDQVQAQFKVANKPKKTDRKFAFSGLLTCAHCGCAITAELKKKVTIREKRELRYVYYHCTGNRGPCDIAYVREEVLDEQFAEIIKQLVIPDKFSNAIIRTLEQTNKDEIDLAQKAIESLLRRKTNLQKKIGKAYEDKLDGKISEEFWLSKTNEWQADLVYVENQLSSRMDSNHNYVEGGKRIIELAKSLYTSYIRQDFTEKRKMLKIVLSNLFLNGANVDYKWAEPFNWLVEIPQNKD